MGNDQKEEGSCVNRVNTPTDGEKADHFRVSNFLFKSLKIVPWMISGFVNFFIV